MTILRIERLRTKIEPDRPPLWLVGLTDLVTLLLAFFILLFSTTVPIHKSWDLASQSLRDRFGSERGANESIIAERETAAKTWQSLEQHPGLELEYLNSIVRSYLKSEHTLKAVRVWEDQDSVILSFGSDLAFELGQETLSSNGENVLKALVPFLSKLPNSLEVTGHTDSTPVSGTGRYHSNWHLSLARANSAALALQNMGYDNPIVIRGRATSDEDLLPASLPIKVRNDLARRVDLRLHKVKP